MSFKNTSRWNSRLTIFHSFSNFPKLKEKTLYSLIQSNINLIKLISNYVIVCINAPMHIMICLLKWTAAVTPFSFLSHRMLINAGSAVSAVTAWSCCVSLHKYKLQNSFPSLSPQTPLQTHKQNMSLLPNQQFSNFKKKSVALRNKSKWGVGLLAMGRGWSCVFNRDRTEKKQLLLKVIHSLFNIVKFNESRVW